MQNTAISVKGRHDPCVVPKAVPAIEAAVAITLADHLIRSGEIQKSEGALNMDEIQKLREKSRRNRRPNPKAIGERVKICQAIGDAKKKQGKPVQDASRENEVYKRVKEKSAQFQLDPDQIERVYREIVNMCSAVQEWRNS